MSSSKTKVVNRILAMALALILFVGIVPLPQIANAIGETNADTTVPETDTTVPETDTTVPETDTTVPETETTEPETQPSNKITIAVTGTTADKATVKINKFLDPQETTSREFNKGTKNITVKVEPKNGYEIVSVKVNDVDDKKNINKDGIYKITFDEEVNENKTIDVKLVKKATIEASADSLKNGVVTFNGHQSPLKAEIGSKITVNVTANENYLIGTVKIGNTAPATVNAKTYSADINLAADTVVEVTYIKLYTVKVKVDENGHGTFITNPLHKDGTVTLKNGSKFTLTATAEKDYRVYSVKDNGAFIYEADKNTDRNKYNASTPYTYEIEKIDKNHEFIIAFAPMSYKVSLTGAEGLKVSLDPNSSVSEKYVDINTEATVYIEEKENEISTVTVNGKVVTPSVDENGRFYYKFKVKNETVISVTAIPSADIALSDFNFTATPKEGFVHRNGHVYVYTKGTKLTITSNHPERTKVYSGLDMYDKYYYRAKDEEVITSTKIVKVLGNRKRSGKVSLLNGNRVEGLEDNPLYFIFDNTAPTATITAEQEVFGSELKFTINASDPNEKIDKETINDSYTGLNSITYQVVDKNGNILAGKGYKTVATDNTTTTDTGVIYTATERVQNAPAKTMSVPFVNEYVGKVTVNVWVTDKSGNTTTITKVFSVDTTAPKVSVDVNGTMSDKALAGSKLYNSKRTVKVSFTLPACSFDANKALECIKLNGTTPTGITWVGGNDAVKTAKDDFTVKTFTAEFTVENDGNYTLTADGYKNIQGTSAGVAIYKGENPNAFIIDTIAPVVEKIKTTTGYKWLDIIDKLTFGLFSTKTVTVVAEPKEDANGIQEIVYYKSSNGKNADGEQLTSTDLNKLYDEGKFVKNVEIMPDESAFVYVRVTDNASNYTTMRTDGIIIDTTDPALSIEEVNPMDFYNRNVELKFSVNENSKDLKSFSGIKKVSYEIVDLDNTNIKTNETIIYNFEDEKTDSWPLQENLKAEKTATIEVDSKKFNSDNIKVTLTATDNAGNTVSVDKILQINTTKPEITVEFKDANKAITEGYFANPRIAEITIKDRNSTFDSVAATAGIKITKAEDRVGNNLLYNPDSTAPQPNAIKLEDMIVSDGWEQAGTDEHKLTLNFSKDANYKWELSYKNKATNEVGMKDVETKSATPFEFTVDKTDPTAKIAVKKDSWSQIVEILTFGFFKENVIVEVIEGVDATNDVTSPYKMEYYISHKETAQTQTELDNLYKSNQFKPYTGPIEKKADELFTVYLRVTDNAGNKVYASTNGIIIDKTPSEILITPNKDIKNGEKTTINSKPVYGIYNKDDEVKFTVDVTEKEPASGIKTVDVWTEVNGVKIMDLEEKGVYLNKANAEYSELTFKHNKVYTIDKAAHNYCDVNLFVKTVDNAGNENIDNVYLDIDNTEPKINVTYNEKQNNGAKDNYYTNRTATIVITERTAHFEADKATKGITITAKDAAGKPVADAYKISSWKTVENAENKNEATHTATVEFIKDANYTFEINYTDKAGNAAKNYKATDFTVDKTAPTGSVTASAPDRETESWTDLWTVNLTYGFWSKKQITVTGESKDLTSPINEIEYFKQQTIADEKTKPLTKAELEQKSFAKLGNGITVSKDEQFVVYLKITDYAGNITYISTNGLMVDEQNPHKETIKPEVSVTPELDRDVYNGDVKVEIHVEDPLVNGTYSGLKNVICNVYNEDVDEHKPSQTFKLFNFKEDITDKKPSQDDIANSKEITKTITIDSKLNNSNNIAIEVYAQDNANNEIYSAKRYICIDTTAPTIDVKYDNNKSDSSTYFKENRTATITVTERNFNPADFVLNIANTDGYIPTLSSWQHIDGTGNWDDYKHVAVITYAKDGDYDFSVDVVDIAKNDCKKTNYAEDTVAPEHFTIDKTMPTVSVSYDNNSALNKNYYAAERTATVTIKEHNLDPNGVDKDRVKVALTASDNGKPSALPRVSSWKRVGDSHVATIRYAADSLYSFDIDIKDKAGNDSKDFEKQEFYVDKTAPELEITGVKDNSANKDKVVPIVTYSDTNFDVNNVQITLSGANRKGVKPVGRYNNTANGSTFVFADFQKKKEVDDIYTLNAKLTDKAGNSTSKQISFSVNRFGSFYKVSENTEKLNGNYSKKPTDIEITEINANKLSDISITLFKNNQTIKLVEGTDYSINVTGGNGRWYTYKYTIFAKNFKDDGVYRIVVHSKDAAGNISENTLDTKNKAVEFGIDKTKPTIVVTNLEDGKTYPVENLQVKFSVKDNLLLNTVTVYLDDYDKPVTQWNKDEVENQTKENNGEFAFMVPGDSKGAHRVKIVTVDAAGNKQIEEIEDFFVTTDIFVRFFNNKPLFYGSIIGLLLVIALVIFIVVYKKKKNELN